MTKEEKSYPIITQNSLMIPCTIDKMEERIVDIVDTPGAFLQTDKVHGNRIVCVRLCGVLVDLLVNIYPETFAEKKS